MSRDGSSVVVLIVSGAAVVFALSLLYSALYGLDLGVYSTVLKAVSIVVLAIGLVVYGRRAKRREARRNDLEERIERSRYRR